MRIAILILGLTACIEGPERDAVREITPQPCETAIAADQQFVINGSYGQDTLTRLHANPPQFELDTPTTSIALDASIGDYGELTLRPQQPLPDQEDVTLSLVSPGALADVYITPSLFPAPYSTRDNTVLRSYRAIDGNIFVSFSQELDAATLASSVSVRRNGAGILSEVSYLEGPQHVVFVRVSDLTGPVEVVFNPNLRIRGGAPVFSAEYMLQLDPAYTVPPADSCVVFR